MRIKKNLKLHEVAGEKMLIINGEVGVDFTKIVMMNKTAEMLWGSLWGRDFSEEDAEDLLIKKYDINKEQAKKDITAWLDSMKSTGLIEA